jgi:transcriptional/translational regulatory protein YebC/TACO1
MLTLIDMGVEDVQDSSDGIEVYVSPDSLREMRKKIEDAGLEVSETEIQLQPKTVQTINDPDQASKILKFLDSFEEHDDVQKVYSNIDIPSDLLPKI